jgi:hypothetical protein
LVLAVQGHQVMLAQKRPAEPHQKCLTLLGQKPWAAVEAVAGHNRVTLLRQLVLRVVVLSLLLAVITVTHHPQYLV